MQSNIENWFKNNNDEIRKYYYLQQDENLNYKCTWEKKEPLDLKFKKNIKWNNHIIILCSNFECNGKIQTIDDKNQFIPILKSNLQKCIRRSDTENALKTSKTMCKISFIEFVRRLSIIMLEDAVLHESFIVLTWFISAYPDFQPTKKDLEILYGIVKYLSDLPIRDYYSKIDSYDFKNKKKNWDKILNHSHISLLYSLQFRASYGGLKGAIKMINSLTEKKEKRMINNNLSFLNYLNFNILTYTTKIKNILKQEIILSSVDFHCYPKMLYLLSKKFPEYDNYILKKTIWFHRSRNTNKILLEGKDEYNDIYILIWNKIEKEVERLSIQFLLNL